MRRAACANITQATHRSYSGQSLLGSFLQPVTTLFPVLSILTILLDKCQLKSYGDINSLIKVKFLCLKNVFSEKKLSFEKKSFGKNKKLLFF